MHDLLGLIRTNAELEEQERPLKEVALNRVFLGNPGTGAHAGAGGQVVWGGRMVAAGAGGGG